MSQIKFYVLVPVYKTEVYIRACIESVLNQTYGNFELIIVDDGTPDRAGVICDAYAAQDHRIHVIHKENQGLISARRAGIHYVKENCSQENAFFIFLDSDDTLELCALEVLNRTLAEHNADVVMFGIQRVSPEGKEISTGAEEFVGVVTDRRELYNRVYSSSSYNSLCRKAIACCLMEDKDYREYYHVSHGEDLLQSIPVYEKCSCVIFIAERLYRYLTNPESITQNFRLEEKQISSTVRRMVWEKMGSEEMTEEDRAKYLFHNWRLLRSLILRIGTAAEKTAEILKYLRRISEDDYFAMVIDRAPAGWIRNAMKVGAYRLVVCTAKIVKMLRSCRRALGK